MSEIRPPSGWQIEQSLALWNYLRGMIDSDGDLDHDEDVIARGFVEANMPPPEKLLERLIDAIVWANRRMAEAEILRKEYVERRDRYEVRRETLRSIALDLMRVLEQRRYRGTIGVARIGRSQPAVVITDAEKLTDEYVKTTREPRKSLIHEHIDAGVIVDGATLSNPGDTLIVTPKV
jgi:hypothetical protein